MLRDSHSCTFHFRKHLGRKEERKKRGEEGGKERIRKQRERVMAEKETKTAELVH